MNLLFSGDNGWWNNELLADLFSDDLVVVTGSHHEKEGNIHRFKDNCASEHFPDILQTYDIDVAVFTSFSLRFDESNEDEWKELNAFFHNLRKAGIQKILYLGTDEIMNMIPQPDQISIAALEQVCEWYRENAMMSVQIVRIPYPVNHLCERDYFKRIVDRIHENGSWQFSFSKEQKTDFLDMRDIADLVRRMIDNWQDVGELQVSDTFAVPFETVGKRLSELFPHSSVTYTDEIRRRLPDRNDNKTIRDTYGWFALHQPLDELDEAENAYVAETKKPFSSKVKDFFSEHHQLVTGVEIVLGGMAAHLLSYYSNSSLQFRLIDYRLLYITLISGVYGTGSGIVAAVLMSLSIIEAYLQQGRVWNTLFYDSVNWLPFIFYFAMATALGYVRQKQQQDMQAHITNENVLQNENQYIRGMYDEAVRYKNEYRRNLVESRDGFGRIYDVVQKLNTTAVGEIFAQSIMCMEEVLNNHSIAIYTISDNNTSFARLRVSSENIGKRVPRSIFLGDYKNIIPVVTEGKVWFNADMNDRLPIYAAGTTSDGSLRVLILIYDVRFEQIGTYFSNLVRILAGLMQNSLNRAFEYEQTKQDTYFIPNTNIFNEEKFEEELEQAEKLAERGLSSHLLFRINPHDKSMPEISEELGHLIRNTDYMGLGKDGKLYLVAMQADESSEGILLDRFHNHGIDAETVRENHR